MFTQRRVDWLTHLIREELLGTLPEEIQRVSELGQSEEYEAVQSALQILTEQVGQLGGDNLSAEGDNLESADDIVAPVTETTTDGSAADQSIPESSEKDPS